MITAQHAAQLGVAGCPLADVRSVVACARDHEVDAEGEPSSYTYSFSYRAKYACQVRGRVCWLALREGRSCYPGCGLPLGHRVPIVTELADRVPSSCCRLQGGPQFRTISAFGDVNHVGEWLFTRLGSFAPGGAF